MSPEQDILASSNERPDGFEKVRSDASGLNLLVVLKGDKPLSASQQVAQFAAAERLQIKQDGERLLYSLNLNGVSIDLGQSSSFDADLKAQRAKLDKLSAELIDKLQNKFGIVIADENEAVDFQRATADSPSSDRMIRSRKPSYFELLAIQSAMEKVSANGDSVGVKIYFPQDQLIEQLNSIATYQRDTKGAPSIYLYKNSLRAITENDLTEDEAKLSYDDANRPETLEGAIVHEFGHHQLELLGLTEGTRRERLFEEMGWVHRFNERAGLDDWLLKGKEIDSDGNNASYLLQSYGIVSSWTRWSVKQGPMNHLGEKTNSSNAEKISDTEIKKHALVPPATWYYTNPEETYAEAYRLYTINARAREYLKSASPRLYEIVKRNSALKSVSGL